MTTRRWIYLSSPIAEVVHRDHLPTISLVQVCEEGTDNSASQVSEVKIFDDVWRRVLYDDFFTLPGIVKAVLWLSRECRMTESVHLVENFTNHVCGIEAEVKKWLVEHDGLDPFIRLELRKFWLGVKRGAVAEKWKAHAFDDLRR